MFGRTPWHDLEALLRDMERRLASESARQPFPFSVAFLPGRSARAYPLINVSEDANNVYVHALAPGLDPDKLEITVLGNTLTISGEKAAPSGVSSDAFHRNERCAGRFVRTIDLHTEVDRDRTEARYANGLLSITLPRSEAARPKQVKVSIG